MSERPFLKGLINAATLDIESFQNKSLRPIIKMKHDTFLMLFKNYISSKKIKFYNSTEEAKKDTISKILTKDNNFKKLIVGVVIGHFSADEMSLYFIKSNEYNRRIIQIVSKRLQDSILDIK